MLRNIRVDVCPTSAALERRRRGRETVSIVESCSTPITSTSSLAQNGQDWALRPIACSSVCGAEMIRYL